MWARMRPAEAKATTSIEGEGVVGADDVDDHVGALAASEIVDLGGSVLTREHTVIGADIGVGVLSCGLPVRS